MTADDLYDLPPRLTSGCWVTILGDTPKPNTIGRRLGDGPDTLWRYLGLTLGPLPPLARLRRDAWPRNGREVEVSSLRLVAEVPEGWACSFHERHRETYSLDARGLAARFGGLPTLHSGPQWWTFSVGSSPWRAFDDLELRRLTGSPVDVLQVLTHMESL